MATVTFSGESSSGWQQANFSSPVAVTANTVYVASYHTNTGHYSDDSSFFASGVDNPPLHALADGVSGFDGVFAYGASSSFPNQGWNSSNYWVDVVLMPTTTTTPLVISTQSLPGGTTGIPYSASLGASGGTTPYAWSVKNGLLPSGLSLNSATGAITGTPTAVGTFNFTVQVADSGSPQQTASQSLTVAITSSGGGSCPCTIWPTTASPSIPDSGPDSAVELGVKFRTDTPGYITGIRFYKGVGNTGTHVGNLWASDGSLLGSLTFSGESSSGWQQANFSTPIAISANTVYVASYHTTVGHYSTDQGFFVSGVDNPPLHALADGISGFDGAFAYGASSSFPNQGWNSSNYWVDVVLMPTGTTTPPSVQSVTPANGTTGASLGTSVSVTFNEAMTAASITGRPSSSETLPAT